MTHSGLSAERVLQLLEPILIAVLLMKLFHEQLQRRYPYFALYLFGFMLQTLIPILKGWKFDTNAYAYFYFASQPLIWAFGFLLIMELFGLVLAEFNGIRSAARLIVKVLGTISVGVSVATALPALIRIGGGSQTMLQISFVAMRTIIIELLFFLATVQFVLLKYRLTLPRNVVFYSIGYALFFSAFAVQAFLISIRPELVAATNVAAISVSCGCLLFWSVALDREGEAVEIAAGPKVSEHERAELRARLTQLSDFVAHLRKRGD
jgi:hypothetical protein